MERSNRDRITIITFLSSCTTGKSPQQLAKNISTFQLTNRGKSTIKKTINRQVFPCFNNYSINLKLETPESEHFKK